MTFRSAQCPIRNRLGKNGMRHKQPNGYTRMELSIPEEDMAQFVAIGRMMNLTRTEMLRRMIKMVNENYQSYMETIFRDKRGRK